MEALQLAANFAKKHKHSLDKSQLDLYLITDALTQQQIPPLEVDASTHIIDTDRSPVRLRKAQYLAEQLRGTYTHIDAIELA